jgi:hypothetical protein
MLIPAIGFWADGIAWIIDDPRGFWECFTLVTKLVFEEMIWH